MRATSHWSCLDMARLMLSTRMPSPALFTATRLFPEIRATSATKAVFSSKAPSTLKPDSDTGRPSSMPASSPAKTSDGSDRGNARPARASSVVGPGSGKGKEENGLNQSKCRPLDRSPNNQGRDPGQEGRTRDTSKKPNDRFKSNRDSSALVRSNSNNNDKQQGSFTRGNKAPPRPRPLPKNMPTNFRTIPATERIESLDKQAVQELFTKRAGSSSVANDAFSIKAASMPFRKPPPSDIPLFVQKAMKEHDKAMAKYKKQLQEFQRLSSSTSTDQVIPTPPNPPKPMVQFKLANRRQYPETIDSPHSPFRVSFMTSKKIVSKLATDRNMVRKKLVAAVEMVFRGDTVAAAAAVSAGATSTTITATPTLARPGYEYLIFPKRAVMWTTQEKLMELMVKELQNPRLYGERDTSKSKSTPTQKSSKNGIETPESVNTDQLDTFATAKEEHSKSMISDPEIKFRWKYNQPPTLEPFWKHSLPNPLSRVHQSNAYLNRFCPDAQEALAPIRQKAGRQRKAAIIYQSKIQRRRSKRS